MHAKLSYMTKFKLLTLLTLVLCGLELSSQAQEPADFKKNTIFLGISMFHFPETSGFHTSINWWIIPNITYQRLLSPKSKLSASFVEYTNSYPVLEFFQAKSRSSETYSVMYGHRIFSINKFSVFVNGGVAVRHLNENWIEAVIVRPGWTEYLTGNYYEWGVGVPFRLDLHYTIKDRINLNAHIDYQYFFDGRTQQFFMGFNVGYNFGK